MKLANASVDSEKVAEKIADEARDDTPQALDAVWEEEQVKFFADQSCGESEISDSPQLWSAKNFTCSSSQTASSACGVSSRASSAIFSATFSLSTEAFASFTSTPNR